MNEDKFNSKADNYAKYRPSYPEKLIDFLYEQTGAGIVADIGAGTGIFTKCLQVKPWKITAVEPNHDMLQKLRGTVGDDVEILEKSAENTGIAENSVDLVTVAQAFHWFDEANFKSECKRILKTGGKLAIIWNSAVGSAAVEAQKRICKEMCPGFRNGHVGQRSSAEGDRFLRDEYFSACDYAEFSHYMSFTLEEYLGNALSRSYALKENDAGYVKFISALTENFDKYSKNGTLAIKYTASCYLGTI